MVEIYALSDATGIRYIGKSYDHRRRYQQHLQSAKEPLSPVIEWVANLLDRGERPKIEVIETCNYWDWEAAERRQIADHLSRGVPLLNVSSGGRTHPFTEPLKNRVVKLVY